MTKKSENSVSYKCEKCKDTTWLINGNSFVRCECYELAEAEKLFLKSGIRDKDYTFSNFNEWNEESKRMKMVATEYYKNFINIQNNRNNSIAFLGQAGGGKTHLTLALGMNLLRTKKISVVYFAYRDNITELKQNSINEEFYRRQLNKFQIAKVLLIDDMLKGKTTDSDKNIMFEIINYRYINHLPIILSSEHSVNDLLNFDEAIGSRIFEMCKDYLVEINKDIKNNYRLK